MKKDDKEKWMEEVLDSLKGSERAKPSPGLYAKIESQLDATQVRIISMRQLNFAVAAAVLVLVLNVFALRQFAQTNAFDTSYSTVTETSSQTLISNYKIYE